MAHDQLAGELRFRVDYRLWLLDDVLRCERLVAHRELQVIRAANKRTAKRLQGYVNARDDKLAEAHRRLARARERLEQLETTPLHVLVGPGA